MAETVEINTIVDEELPGNIRGVQRRQAVWATARWTCEDLKEALKKNIQQRIQLKALAEKADDLNLWTTAERSKLVEYGILAE